MFRVQNRSWSVSKGRIDGVSGQSGWDSFTAWSSQTEPGIKGTGSSTEMTLEGAVPSLSPAEA